MYCLEGQNENLKIKANIKNLIGQSISQSEKEFLELKFLYKSFKLAQVYSSKQFVEAQTIRMANNQACIIRYLW